MPKIISVMTILILLVLACGENKETTEIVESADQNPATPEGKEKLFEEIVNELVQRLKYRDRSFNYEMEFPYYRDEHTYDEYVGIAGVPYGQVDTLEFIDIVSIESYEPDSIVATSNSHFKGPTGYETVFEAGRSTFYLYQGTWIRPTFSSYLEHEIRQTADSAAQAEEEELGR